MFRKKYFIFTTVILILYLTTSNFYMYKLFDDTTEKIKKINIEHYNEISYLESHKGLYFWLLNPQEKYNMISVNIDGGFYDKKSCENIKYDNMSLYLLGKTNYIIESYNRFSPFLTRTNDISGSYKGFNSNFNTFIVKDGVYSLGIMDQENNIIKSTERKIYKRDNKVMQTAYDLNDDEVKRLMTNNYKNINNTELTLINPTKIKRIDKNLYNISGILFIKNENIDSYDSVAYIKIMTDNESKIYRIPMLYNEWMEKNIGEYSRISMFITNVYIEDFDEANIEYMIVNNNQLYKHDKIYYYQNQIDNDNLTLSFTHQGYNIKYNPVYDNMLREKYIGIDKDNKNFIFRGSLYKENDESSSYDIIVEIRNENGNFSYNVPKTYSKYMADIEGEKYAYSHILLNLSKEQLSNNGVIKLYLKKGDNYYTTGREYEYFYDNETYIIKDDVDNKSKIGQKKDIFEATEGTTYKSGVNELETAYDLNDDEIKRLMTNNYKNINNTELTLINPTKIKRIDKNLYNISGILFIKNENIDSYDSVAYIKIMTDNESKIYRIPMLYNEWMEKNIGEYSRISMFITNVYIEDFDEANIEYMIVNNNQLYKHDKIYYYQNQIDNDNLTLSFTHQGYNIKYNPVYDNMLREKYIGIDKDNKNFIFRGSLYKENDESSSYDIIVEIRNENGNFSYNVPKTYSKYMADIEGEKYAYSHILLNLSKEQLSNNGVIKLYLKKGDNYYTTGREYIYNFENDTYSIK